MLASQSYQWILQEESHIIGLQFIQIDKYKIYRRNETQKFIQC